MRNITVAHMFWLIFAVSDVPLILFLKSDSLMVNQAFSLLLQFLFHSKTIVDKKKLENDCF